MLHVACCMFMLHVACCMLHARALQRHPPRRRLHLNGMLPATETSTRSIPVIVYVCRVNEALSILACVACACMHVARACARAGLLVRVSARCFGVCTCICRGRMCARVGASVRNFAASERRSAAKEARSDRRPIAPAQTRARPSTHAHMCVRVCTS